MYGADDAVMDGEGEIALNPIYSHVADMLQQLTTDQRDKLLALAASVYPVHFGSKEIAVREGDLAEDVYFIQSGRMRVLRQVNFTVHPSSPSMKLLELATLEPGEYFGELGVLRYNVDAVKSVNVGSLLTVSEAEIDEEDPEKDFLVINPATPSVRRQATIYAHTPSECLVLPRDAFISLVQQGPLVRMREYAKGYPSSNDIVQFCTKQQEWAAFKTSIYESHRVAKPGVQGGDT